MPDTIVYPDEIEEELGERLEAIWSAQAEYNERVKSIQKESRWGEIYLLGLVGEVNEILDATGWKRHKRGQRLNKANIGRELADATKYLLSLWQEYGFSLMDVISQLEEKQSELDQQWAHDWQPPSGACVIITDLDGTVADFRSSFSEYAKLSGVDLSKTHSLQMDVDNGFPFSEYQALKDKFEGGGGYADLAPYGDAVCLLAMEHANGTRIYVTTARPVDRYQRIWQDTIHWLHLQFLSVEAVRFGDDVRLEELRTMQQRGNKVVLLEDNPTSAMRAATMGFRVYLRDQPYNRQIQHKNIIRCTVMPTRIPWEEL